MATALGQAPGEQAVTLSADTVTALTVPSGSRYLSIEVDSGGASVAFARSGQTDGQAPSGSNYLLIRAGERLEDVEMARTPTTVYIWRLTATSTTVRVESQTRSG